MSSISPVRKVLKSKITINRLWFKLRKISKNANKSSKFKYAIKKEQKKKNLRVLSLKQEVKTRFTATHTMIRSFMNDPNEGKEDDTNVDFMKENVAAKKYSDEQGWF